MSSSSCWPIPLVRNLKSSAAKPTPQPVTVAYSAVEAPASSRTMTESSRTRASVVLCMSSPDCRPLPFGRGEFPCALEDSRSLARLRPEFRDGGQPSLGSHLWTAGGHLGSSEQLH